MKNTKKLVVFLKQDFEKAQNDFVTFAKIQSEIKKELETLLNVKLEINDFGDEPLKYYFNYLETSPNNTLGLPGEKIAELLQQKQSMSKLKDLDKQFHESKCNAPKLQDFSIYAETDDEINRLEKFENLKKAFEDFIKVDETANLNIRNLINAIPYRSFWNHHTNELTPQIDWLKKGKIVIHG